MKEMLTTILQPQEACAALVQCKNAHSALLYAYGQTVGGLIDPLQAEKVLLLSNSDIHKAADCLLAYGICKKTREYTPSNQSASPDELIRIAQTDYGFQGICKVYEHAKGSCLIQPEIEMLYDIYANLNISADMITLLIGMLKDAGRFSRFNMQKTAYEWNDANISTYEGAEQYMNAKYAKKNNYMDLMRVLGIVGRDPVSSERKYLDNWIAKKIPIALISYAYEKTVYNVKELKWPYMNKILESWHTAGYQTREDVDAGEARSNFAAHVSPSKATEKGKIALLNEEYSNRRREREEAASALVQKLMVQSADFAENQRSTMALSQKIAMSALLGSDVAQLRVQSQELAARRKVILRNLGITEDMISPKPICEKCGDYGYIGSEMCTCFKKRLTEL